MHLFVAWLFYEMHQKKRRPVSVRRCRISILFCCIAAWLAAVLGKKMTRKRASESVHKEYKDFSLAI